jgi:hypothetical protein
MYPTGKPGSSYTIPDTATTIGDSAFKYCKLQNIIIPESVTTISDYAFAWSSSLSGINLPDHVTVLGAGAFHSCISLTSITIPDSITSISSNLFYRCNALNSIIIPGSVTSIAYNSFYGCTALTGITLPDSVTYIGGYAFGDSGLISITLPDRLTSITYHAFRNCESLRSVVIPGSVASIGEGVFAYCPALTDITFLGLTPPATGSEWIDNTRSTLRGHAYYGSSFPAPGSSFNGLTMGSYIPEDYYYTITSGQATITTYRGADDNVTIPATLGGCPVTGIGNNAFAGHSAITGITIPSSVTCIGDNAFSGCFSLTGITIPDAVTSIGNGAFTGCSFLTGITFLGLTPPTTGTDWIDSSNPDLYGHAYYGASFPGMGITFNGLMMGDYIPEGYYYTITGGQATITQCMIRSRTDITIPSTLGGYPVVAIGDRAFQRLLLTSVTIPSGVTSIGNSAFYACILMNSVTIADSVTSIGDSAFKGCSALTGIILPDSVTGIGSSAFEGCSALTSITLPGSIASIGESTFSSCRALTDITLENGIAGIGESAFLWCSSLTGITLPDSITTIGNGAFQGCTSLAGITMPRSVTSVGQFVFHNCFTLTEINVDTANLIYKSVNGILFNQATTALVQYPVGKSDTSYVIPVDVTAIGTGAFSSCTALTGVTIPESVTSIGNGAFYECESITGLIIPDSVTSIGDYAFESCILMSSITLPSGLTSIGDYLFSWCDSLMDITLPESVTSIGEGAFQGCFSLTGITIPKDVTSIGGSAFSRCSSMSEITFLSLTPPTIVDSSNWLYRTDTDLVGHAWFGAGFPAPGNPFNGLVMGSYIASPITGISPSSPLILYTRGTSATQTFAASYENHGLITSAILAIDSDTPLNLDPASFSSPLTLAVGSHTITLTVRGAAGNEATQTWNVNVIQDTTAPSITGIKYDIKITNGSSVAVCLSDTQSGVKWDSLKVYIDNKDMTAKITMNANGFTIPSNLLSKGEHSVKLSISDNVGNTAEVKGDIKVK